MAEPQEPKDKPSAEPEARDQAELDTLSDGVTDAAVDDIVRTESDELLDAQDRTDGRFKPTRVKHGFWRSIGHFFAAWWHHKSLRWVTIMLLVGGCAGAWVVPGVRYWVLNHAGVRVSASVIVLDDTTGLPLKDIDMTIDGVSASTGVDGRATIGNLLLGPHQLTVSEPGFSTIKSKVVLGWGSNPLGEFELEAVGVQYTLQVQDYLTNKPVANAEVSVGDAVALSNKEGKVVLTLPVSSEPQDVVATVVHSGYRNQQATLKYLTKEVTPVSLVTTRKVVFVSKQSGTYDVYSSDIDGEHKKVILAGTGNEDANITLAVSTDGERAALVSTRDNQRDAAGFLLSTLTLINVMDSSTVTITHAEQIQLVDWVGSRLVFEQVSEETKTPLATRYAIISYDYATNTRLQLAASPHFNTVLNAQGYLYYAVADSDTTDPIFARIKSDGTGKQQILDKEVWSAYRTDYNVLSLQTAEGWYTYDLASGKTAQVSAPSSYTTRGYMDNSAGTQSLWTTTRDGLGVLLRTDKTTGQDTAIHTQSGLGYPVQWFGDDAAIFRVVNGGEVADYILGTGGSQTPHKVADVVNTYGLAGSQ